MTRSFHLPISGFVILALFAVGCAHPPVPKTVSIESLGTIGIAAWPDELPVQSELPVQEENTTAGKIVDGVLFLPKEIVKRTVAFSVGTLTGCVKGLSHFPTVVNALPTSNRLNFGGSGSDKGRLVAYFGLAASLCLPMGAYEAVHYAVLPDDLYVSGVDNTYVGARGDNAYRQNAVKEEIRRRVFAAINKNDTEPVQILEQQLGYEQLSAQGVDTVMDISLEQLSLVGGGFDRVDELSINIEINVSLIKTNDRKEVYNEAFNYYLEGRRLQTGHSNSKLVDHELDLAYQNLADQVVAKISQEFPPASPLTVSEKQDDIDQTPERESGGRRGSGLKDIDTWTDGVYNEPFQIHRGLNEARPK